ncbi:MAG TPA: thioesterase domain-containing protein [Dictyobacter sp.]|nr:thioesterase domain-containing protein [Dictyobacter sp.]
MLKITQPLLKKRLIGKIPLWGQGKHSAAPENILQQDSQTDADAQMYPQAPIHRIQKGKTKRPFFFLHGSVTGKPLYCFTLARTLGREQPFYALDTYQYTKGQKKPLTFEAVAAEHVKAICSVQPEGPYLLGGFCNGAYAAYEVAHQLQAQGQEVELLVLISPIQPSSLPKKIHRTLQGLGKLFHLSKHMQLLAFMYMRHMLRHIYRMLLPAHDPRVADFSSVLALDPRLDHMFPPTTALFKDYINPFTWLLCGYKMRYHPKHIEFIWSAADTGEKKLWDTIRYDPDPAIIPGNHLDCVTNEITLLATHMKTSIERVQAQLPALIPSTASN